MLPAARSSLSRAVSDYYDDYDDDMGPDGDELKKTESEDAEFECLNVFQVSAIPATSSELPPACIYCVRGQVELRFLHFGT